MTCLRAFVAFAAALAWCGAAAAGDQPDARRAFDAMNARYATAVEYRDEGICRTDVESLPTRLLHVVMYGRAHDKFATSFVRGGPTRFIYVEPDGRTHHAAAGITEAWRAAIGQLSGVTNGVASTVPRLLLRDRSVNSPSQLQNLRLLPPETIRRTGCLVVTGTTPHYEMTLWISRADFHLVRAVRRFRSGDPATVTIDYDNVVLRP